jgi:hypothetical protein
MTYSCMRDSTRQTAIQTVAQVTERAAAGSEEMASSSEELGAQATALREPVGQFRTEGTGRVSHCRNGTIAWISVLPQSR